MILSYQPFEFDQSLNDVLKMPSGKVITGMSINSFTMEGDKFPLVHGSAVTSTCDELSARQCLESCLDEKLVKGKIVICEEIGVTVAFKAGALGAVALSSSNGASLMAPMPAVTLNSDNFDTLISYVNSTKKPVGKILKSESINDTSAPVVALFSSRGPNTIAFDILKPDITAPGVDILAAYSPLASVTREVKDPRSVPYSLKSGTSMSCPHVAGVAAYLKSLHPDWSPSALKSALMTTARVMDPASDNLDEFAYGSGHINPIAAANPGLVYEATKEDYKTFLCKSGYTLNQVRAITGHKTISCPKNISTNSFPNDLNYPSMQAKVKDESGNFNLAFHRTVTNVGIANSTYVAKIDPVMDAYGMKVRVVPDTLSFKKLKEHKSFKVTVEGTAKENWYYPTHLVWSDGIHSVRSPIVIYRLKI